MLYARTEYQLGQVAPRSYARAAQNFKFSVNGWGLSDALHQTVDGVAPGIAGLVRSNSEQVHRDHEDGAAQYVRAFCIGFMALSAVNSVRIEVSDWDTVLTRDLELRFNSRVDSQETAVQLALDEILLVNTGYVRGYRETFSSPELSHSPALSGLGTVHAHDLLHFAAVAGRPRN